MTAERAATRARELKARWPADPLTAWQELDALFRSGGVPEPSLDGDYRGELLATRTLRPFDALIRWFDRQGLWWRGKSFNAGGAAGENRWDRRFRWGIRLCWPLYRDVRVGQSGEIRAFRFRTWIGPGVADPDVPVLKIDYAAEANPLALRGVLDELVQIAPGYYLGKAHLRFLSGCWRTVAFFALRRSVL
jgi:hypothetical protein